MTSREFMAVLNTVEQDHELVLHKVKALKKALVCLLEPEHEGPRQVLERLREANEFFATNFAAHLAEEERTLFPFLQKHNSEGAEIVAGLIKEHAKIGQMREEFGNCLQVAFELEDGPPWQVLRDLMIYGWQLWEALDQHAHGETRAFRQCLGQSFAGVTAPADQ